MTVKQAVKELQKCPSDAVLVVLGDYEDELQEVGVENEGTLTSRHSFVNLQGINVEKNGTKFVLLD